MASMANPEAAARSPRASFTATFRTFVRDLFDDYRPERHYMRGPGPKWREKHAPKPATAAAPQPLKPLYPGSVPA
jgi:hypothetical protein